MAIPKKKKKHCCEGMMQLHNLYDNMLKYFPDDVDYTEQFWLISAMIDNCPFCRAVPKRILTENGYADLTPNNKVFVLDDDQVEKYEKWRDNKKIFPKLIGDQPVRCTSFVFTPDGIGMGVEAVCDDKRIDLTDYDNI